MTDTTYNPGATKSASYTGTAGAAEAVSKKTTKIRIYATTDCFIKITTAGTSATTSDMPLTGKIAEYFDCDPSSIVSFIQQSAGGTGYVTEMSKE